MIKTVTTTAGVNTVTFPEFFKYFWIKNIGDTTVYASAYTNVSAGVDNTSTIKSGDAVCIENVDNDNVYISGAGSVEIHAQDFPDCSFKVASKGGGSGGGNSTLDTITEFPENPIDNKPYLYPNSDIGDIIAVHFENTWHFSALNQYPFEHMLNAADLYASGQVIDTPADAVSVIDRTTVFADRAFTNAVKISGMGVDNADFIFEMSINFRSAATAKIYVGISAESSDKCYISLNGELHTMLSSTKTTSTDPAEDIYEISIVPAAGVNTIKLRYNKDSSNSYGEDAIFIYGVRFTTG